jgi:tRNA nucleotidyltransferase (CCA-adding enzyme)
MKTYIERLPSDVRSLICHAQSAAQNRVCEAYLVGGFVRDLLLGVKNLDIDIVVEGNGIGFAQEYARLLKGKLVTHHRFGTATVSAGHHVKVDISSARKEFYPHPAHLPVVESGSLRDDMFRRDFTVNAMALQITGAGYGRLVDFFGGRKDLEDKKLRVLHPASFIDDPTRILRGIRFEQRYDLVFDKSTLELLKEAVKRSMLERVEPQRLRDELIFLLKEDKPFKIVKRMAGLTGFSFINPELRMSAETARVFAALERWVRWFDEHSPKPRKLDSWLVFFMGLIGSLSIHEVHAVCRRFVFTKGEEKRIISSVEKCEQVIRALRKKTVRRSDIFHMLEPLSYEVIIMMLAQTDSDVVATRIKGFLKVSHGTKISVSGHDLGAWGLKPGPHYQSIFREVLNAKLDGKLKNKAEELLLAKKIVSELKNRKE